MNTCSINIGPAKVCEVCVNSSSLQKSREGSATAYPLSQESVLFDDPSYISPRAKSQNVTHCVTVPTSEHVAEIVGRQGCKIKALRAKTNTYIKTPVRGEDPVFIVTGRPEDVSAAKREILAAADHFTQIRAARRSSTNSLPSSYGSPVEEKVTIFVRVPYRVVGLVVGPKGATIKRIQQITNTYIVTPSRDKEPCFEVTGCPDSVERARKEIESYIAMRTGGSVGDSDPESDYPSVLSPVESVFSPIKKLSESKIMQLCRTSTSPPDVLPYSAGLQGGFDAFGGAWGERSLRNNPLSNAVFKANADPFLERYSGMSMPMSAPVSSVNNVFDFSSIQETPSGFKPHPSSPTNSCGSNSSEGTAAVSPKGSPRLFSRHRLCFSCRERDIMAALVPCGHNFFCIPCAQSIACLGGQCPVCDADVSTVLRIHN
ncbi:hypothetical protein EMCRGX_G022266 [Ephydatia muelleri]